MVGTRGNFGFAFYVAEGNDSLVAVTRPIYVAPPGCVVNGASYLVTGIGIQEKCLEPITSAQWVVIVNFLLEVAETRFNVISAREPAEREHVET